MNFPNKWREAIDPYKLKFKNFELLEVLGYPHAGNDVFYARGLYKENEVFVFIKVNRQNGADVKNEVETLNKINLDNTPIVIDYDDERHTEYLLHYLVKDCRLFLNKSLIMNC